MVEAAPAPSEDDVTQQPRICLVSRREPGTTGTSRYVDHLQTGLRQRGWDVTHLATRPGGRIAAVVDATGKRLGIDTLTFLSAYPLTLHWPRSDVYHLTAHTYASAIRISPPPGPCVVTVHDIGVFLERRSAGRGGLRRRAQHAAERYALGALKRCDSLITDSAWTKQTLVDEIAIPAERVTVVPLGVDHLKYRPLQVPEDFRQRYGLSKDERYVLYVGSDEPRKNLPTIWRALGSICDELPNVRLIKVGRGYDAGIRARLVRLAAELGVDGTIRYFDAVPEDDLPLFYNLAEMLLIPSLYEGFGFPALEAMACGTPVVASDRGSLPEVTGRDGAVLVDPTDAASLAAAVIELMKDPQWAAAVAAHGHERSFQFTWEATLDKTVAVYQRAGSRSSVNEPEEGREMP